MSSLSTSPAMRASPFRASPDPDPDPDRPSHPRPASSSSHACVSHHSPSLPSTLHVRPPPSRTNTNHTNNHPPSPSSPRSLKSPSLASTRSRHSLPPHPPPTSFPTRSVSTSNLPTTSAPRPRTPFHRTYQPRGAVRALTDTLDALRSSSRSSPTAHEDAIDRQRIFRRWIQLLLIHQHHRHHLTDHQSSPHPPQRLVNSVSAPSLARPLDLLQQLMRSPAAKLKEAEQGLVAWQPDHLAPHCPLCLTPFHPLRNRKHHCRLCGRVVCSLPPDLSDRARPCSVLLTTDAAVLPEWHPAQLDLALRLADDGQSMSEGVGPKPDRPHGIRVCSTCSKHVHRSLIARRLAKPPPTALLTLERLHADSLELEARIASGLEELMDVIALFECVDQVTEQNVERALQIRNDLARLLPQYDQSARKIKEFIDLRARDGKYDLTLRTIRQGVASRANAFLKTSMRTIQDLIIPQAAVKAAQQRDKEQLEVEIAASQTHDAAALAIQPLLEQERQLEKMIEEATSQRRIQDAATISQSLKELRIEIKSLLEDLATA